MHYVMCKNFLFLYVVCMFPISRNMYVVHIFTSKLYIERGTQAIIYYFVFLPFYTFTFLCFFFFFFSFWFCMFGKNLCGEGWCNIECKKCPSNLKDDEGISYHSFILLIILLSCLRGVLDVHIWWCIISYFVMSLLPPCACNISIVKKIVSLYG